MDLKQLFFKDKKFYCYLELNNEKTGFFYWRVDSLHTEQHKMPIKILAYNTTTQRVAFIANDTVFQIKITYSDNKKIHIQFTSPIKNKKSLVIQKGESFFKGAKREKTELLIQKKSSLNTSINNTIKSPLVGRIVRILVKANDFITKGSPLICIESMKMENTVCAESNFFIQSILIKEGDVVQANQDLMIFDAKRGYDEYATESTTKEKI